MGKETVITAPTMAEALSKVRRELGIDALILSHQESLGNVSITARAENTAPLTQRDKTKAEIPDWIRQSSPHRKPADSAQTSLSASSASVDMNTESKERRIAIPTRRSDFKQFINSASSFDETLSAISAVCDLCDFHQLGDALGEAWLKEMNPEFAHHPIQLTPALDRVITTDPTWLDNISSAGQIVLVGPPGCGKTVTIAKLAAMLLERGKKVRIVTLDTLKSSGAWQLEEYLKPLSLEIYIGPDYLPDTRPKEIILIDTPALNINLQRDCEYLKALKTNVNVPFTLVLPADMNPVDADEIAASYRDANAKTIIVTRLELSKRCGVPLRAAYQGLELVLTSKSPNLAEGLQCVTSESLLERMLAACETSL